MNFIAFQFESHPQYCQSWTIRSIGICSSRKRRAVVRSSSCEWNLSLQWIYPKAHEGSIGTSPETALYEDMTSLYRLDQIAVDGDGKKMLGKLPPEAVALITSLVVVWILMGLYVLKEVIKKKKS